MSEFRFRLQRVLEYRELVEGWAKDAYLEARAAHLEAIAEIDKIDARRGALVFGGAQTLEDRRTLEACLEKLADDERQQKVVIAMLADDESKRQEEWLEARKELQSLEKLRDAALADWIKEENRREQKELDEWALQRRSA